MHPSRSRETELLGLAVLPPLLVPEMLNTPALQTLDLRTSLGIFIGGLVTWYFATSLWTVICNLYRHPIAKFPGALFILSGCAFLDTKRLHERYGKVVRTSPNALSFITAEAWKGIYNLKPDRTENAKDPSFYQADGNILSANQKDHTRFRRLYAHAFTDTALLEQESLLNRYFDLLVTKLKERIDGPENGRVNIMASYNFTAFDIIGNGIDAVRFIPVFRVIAMYLGMAAGMKVLAMIIPSLTAKSNAHADFTKRKTEARLDLKTDRKDFMSNASFTILQHNDDKRGMSRSEIIANSRVILDAGSETVATTLAGTTYLLLQNRSTLHRVQSEVRTAFETGDAITLRSSMIPGRLPYLEAVIEESLRCFPPIPSTFPRKISAVEGDVIDGYHVPKDISVGVHQWSTYRSSLNFFDPDTFDPERWMPDPPAKYRNDNRAAFQPFSLGPRGCIGRSLAYFETRSILARMLWHFDMQLEDESKGWIDQKEYVL
ncbi:MAG: hypothetical protein Q9215_006069 [Flavoplaca cf. flavocitrina]